MCYPILLSLVSCKFKLKLLKWDCLFKKWSNRTMDSIYGKNCQEIIKSLGLDKRLIT